MNVARYFALFIVLFMAASIVGFGIMYKAPTSGGSTGTNEPPPLVNPGEQQEVSFTASGIDASVLEIFPSVRIAGETKETNISKIDSAIYQITGVSAVSSVYSQPGQQQTPGALIYVATVSFDKDLNSDFIISQIRERAPLSTLDGFVYGLIQIPNKITMYSADQQIDLNKSYSFKDDTSEALVGLGTIKGDEIKVELQASFVGEELTKQFSYETQNITATPILKEAEIKEAEIASLEQRLEISAEINYTQMKQNQSIKQALEGINDVNSADVSIPNIQSLITVSAEKISEQQLLDMNSFFGTLGAANVQFLNDVKFDATLSFGDVNSLSQPLASIREKLATMQIDANTQEATSEFSAELGLSSADAKAVADSVSAFFSSKGMEAKLLQPAKIAAQQIVDAEGVSYEVPGSEIAAYLKPGYSVGGKVDAKVTFYLVRGKIAYALAEEK